MTKRTITLELSEDVICKMADVYTEGYRVGFVNTGKDLSKKGTVEIRNAAKAFNAMQLRLREFIRQRRAEIIRRGRGNHRNIDEIRNNFRGSRIRYFPCRK